MANKEQLEILKSGVENWNRWRRDNPDLEIDLAGSHDSKVEKNTLTHDHKITNLFFPDKIGANILGVNLQGANLSGVILNNARLYYANLINANLNGANLEKASLYKACLSGANLEDANLKGASLYYANLKGANLRGANLERASLSRASLVNACFEDANLIDASLVGTDLKLANLLRANLKGVNFHASNLSGSCLEKANLVKANFKRSKVDKAIFNGAFLGSTLFINTNLSLALDLETCKHICPSTIDFQTMSKSSNIPYFFLNGCGISDHDCIAFSFPVYKPEQTQECFIFYSLSEQEFADRLFSDLQKVGIRAWYVPHDLKDGQIIIDQIDKRIKITDKLLLILSENSIGSKWVKTVITKAQNRKDQIGRNVLLTISITKYDMLKEWEFYLESKGISQEIRDYYLLDFENWKNNEAYKKNFDRLVESLKIK